MRDLISRSALIQLFEDKMFNDRLMNPVIKMSDVIEIIEEQPVAYDKEAVIKQLEIDRQVDFNYHIRTDYCFLINNIYDRTVQKVREGGVNEKS